MARFAAKHLLFLLLTLLVVSFLVFTLNEFSPGAVARKILGAYATQDQVDQLTKQMGLDRPLLVRYVDYLRAVAAGDLGQSMRFKAPVREVIAKHLANTALLAAIAFACIVPLSMVLGVVAGMREGSRLDRVILMLSTVVASIPEFALGVFLASVFVVWLGWLPGTATLVAGGGWSVAAQLVLPVAVIVLFDAGYVVSMIRASMVEVMQRPYIRTAVLKGLSFRRVIVRHALRNAMITPITVIMLQINYLVAGVVVVETVSASRAGTASPGRRAASRLDELADARGVRPGPVHLPAALATRELVMLSACAGWQPIEHRVLVDRRQQPVAAGAA
jgi:peptide/nickel transport system permease protein